MTYGKNIQGVQRLSLKRRNTDIHLHRNTNKTENIIYPPTRVVKRDKGQEKG